MLNNNQIVQDAAVAPQNDPAKASEDIKSSIVGFLRSAGLYATLLPVVAYGLLFLFFVPTFFKYQIPLPLMRFDISIVVVAVLGAALLYILILILITLIMACLSLVGFSSDNSSLVALVLIACPLGAVFFWNKMRLMSYFVIGIVLVLLVLFLWSWLHNRNVQKAVEEFQEGVPASPRVFTFLSFFGLKSNSYDTTHLLLIIVVMILPVFMMGELYADLLPTFYLVDSDPKCVVVYQTTDYAICLPVDLRKAEVEVGPEYQIIKYSDNRDIKFRRVYLGPLKPLVSYSAQDVTQGNYFMPSAGTPAPSGDE